MLSGDISKCLKSGSVRCNFLLSEYHWRLATATKRFFLNAVDGSIQKNSRYSLAFAKRLLCDSNCLRVLEWENRACLPVAKREESAKQGSHCLYKESAEKHSPSVVNRLPKYPVGSRVYFKCKVGYDIDGQSSRRCIGMKRWDGDAPQCRKIECPPPPTIDNAIYISKTYLSSKTYSHGEFLKVGCNRGYFLQGPRKITCLWNRTWSEHPTCSSVSNHCHAFPDLPENSNFVTKLRYKVIIKCKDMYEPSTEFKFHCGSDGQWHGERPTCYDQRLCRLNPCKNHGRCLRNHERVYCECTEKYTGTYCEEEIKCNFTPFIGGGFKPLTREYYSVGEKVPLICDEGFERAAGEATCLRNGEWNYRGTCRAMTCESPPLPLMGLVECNERSWKAGDVIYIKCKIGYELHGNNIVQCQLDGTWSGLEGVECRATECDRPRLPQQAQLANDKEVYSIGENVEVSCNEGYELAGESSLECQQDKTWSPSEAQVVCNVRQNYPCNAPDPPDNAVFDNDGETFPTRTSITFHCRDGYVLLGGDPTWTCENGRWTKTNAACDVGEPCSHPDLPKHSFIVDGVQEFPSGTTISFGCRNERRLSENAPWSCNNGEWTKTDFTCIAQNCLLDGNHLGLYGFGIANMELQGDQRFPIGEQLTLTCLFGGTPRHRRDEATRPRMICQNDGTWAPSYKGFTC